MEFKLHAPFKPTGDQPQAIEKLARGVELGLDEQVLLGVTGSGKTFTMASVIEKVQRPTLVLAHNKTLAAQLCAEFKEFFPENAVEYFVSYYDYYQPEAYIPHTDTYIAKDASTNEEIDRLRLSATCALLERRDVIVVSSVSCIYGLGEPEDFEKLMISLRPGMTMERDFLLKRLIEIRYERNDVAFERNRFRVRGDTVELYPAYYRDKAVRVEFFDDEVDAMGEFDLATQRRTQNVKTLTVLPAAEVLPALSAGGREKMLERLSRAAQKIEKKAADSPIVKTLRGDIERLANDLPLGGMDRYLAACYPDEVCALDYLSPDTLIAVSDGMRVLERSKNYHWELSEDVKPLIEEGVLCGEFASLALSQEALSHRMSAFPVLLLDSLPTSRNLLPPRAILSMNARSLPSYGGSLETAAGDMERYLGAGCGVLVLCGNETRAKNFRRLLEERNIRAQLNLKNDRLPAPHETVIGLGALSAGSEYPQLKLVILTEGQLTAPLSGKRAKARPKKETSARAALRSYDCLLYTSPSPRD